MGLTFKMVTFGHRPYEILMKPVTYVRVGFPHKDFIGQLFFNSTRLFGVSRYSCPFTQVHLPYANGSIPPANQFVGRRYTGRDDRHERHHERHERQRRDRRQVDSRIGRMLAV
jgi:hypothetical protein